jgi:hypothetical protein
MAVIAQTAFNKTSNGPITVTRTVLSASDTLVYTPGAVLELFNTTASPVVVTIDGSGATTISPTGYGGTVDISAGKAITVGASSTVYVQLDSIAAFLAGTVAVTGGVGVTAHITV